MKIFLTGHMGYVGSVLTQVLVKNNFEVTGCDIGYYPFNFTEQENLSINVLKKDIRNLTKTDVEGHDAILHLAALSNDPLGDLYPSLTNEINYLATLKLAKLAKEAKVERFVFSSSCSTYGVNKEAVDENSPLDPLTTYAKTKVNSERELRKLGDEKDDETRKEEPEQADESRTGSDISEPSESPERPPRKRTRGKASHNEQPESGGADAGDSEGDQG